MTDLTIRVSDEDVAWLEEQGEENGLDPEQVVRMMVRRARRAGIADLSGSPGVSAELARRQSEEAARAAEEKRLREIAERRAALQAELAALDGATVVKQGEPADEFDESLLSDPIPQSGVAEYLRDVAHLPPAPHGGPPGTLTRPAGVNRYLERGVVVGDAHGNVVRQNFGHLGSR